MKERLERWMQNSRDRTAAMTMASFAMNALIGIGKLVLGVYLLSVWFMTTAVYYLILGTARGLILKRFEALKQIEDSPERYELEFAAYKKSGVFLCLLGLSYLLVCLRMYMVGDAAVFGGHTVFLIALVAFTKLVVAIRGTVVNRHLRDPIVSALKIINFTDAMVSIVVTQYTLLVMTESDHAMRSSALLGMGCSLLFVCIGIFMLCKKKNGGHSPPS